ncbi:MAG: alpha/beta fold hydrolase [Dehalococcoidia bacterium]
MSTQNASEHFMEVNGVKLRYFSWGSESNPKMICLHGHTGQARIWDEFAEEMSASYHVLAFDQRGHGASSYAEDGYDRDKFVNDLDAIIETLNIDRVTLVGLSMGGWHSILYTSEFHPEKVEKMVIVDIGPESSEEFKKSFTEDGVRVEPKIKFSSFEEAFNESRSNNPWVSDEGLTRDLTNRLNQNADGTYQWKADPNLIIPPLKDGTDENLIRRYWEGLAKIDCPILEVQGMESTLLDSELKDKMLSTAKNLSWVDVPNAGHVVTVDQPQLFINATREFLS